MLYMQIYNINFYVCGVSQVVLVTKNPPMQVQSLGQEDPLEEGMATHSSILA